MTVGERLRRDPYAQAAVGYFVYGLFYLGGAIVVGPGERAGMGGLPPWFYYLFGALLVVLLPLVPWFRQRVFTGILGGLVLIRAVILATRIGSAPDRALWWGVFAAIALAAALLMLRAAFGRQQSVEQPVGADDRG